MSTATLPAIHATRPVRDAPRPPTRHVLAEPPALAGARAAAERILHRAFIALNRGLMIPLHHAGLSAWLGSPLAGYQLLLRVRGRKSGMVREIPLSYLIADGSVWVLAGFGPRTEWYRNLLADPAVEVHLPGRRYAAAATPVTDPDLRARIAPALVRATGLPGFLTGVNPWTADDRAILAAIDWVPLVRIVPRPGPIEPGPDDPGGTAWIWRQAIALGATALAARVARLVFAAARGAVRRRR